MELSRADGADCQRVLFSSLSTLDDYKWEFKERPRDFGTWPYLFDSMKNRVMTFWAANSLYI